MSAILSKLWPSPLKILLAVLATTIRWLCDLASLTRDLLNPGFDEREIATKKSSRLTETLLCIGTISPFRLSRHFGRRPACYSNLLNNR